QGKASALRAAKLHYLETATNDWQRSPYYWSGFVYFGVDDPLDFQEDTWPWTWPLIVGALLLLAFAYRRNTAPRST
ncbi:MAG: hypothetical protein AAGD05_19325, partial [Bacteroidota bacterium]